MYRQRSGVCIGSKVAPVLSNIFLARVDRNIDKRGEDVVIKVLRYVDDFLVFVKKCDFKQTVTEVVQIFHNNGFGLQFTHEVPNNNQLQFLDVKLYLTNAHVCWEYSPRSEKPILNFNSSHSKIVKNGIAFSCLLSALSRSCFHQVSKSFVVQMERLRTAGFPEHVLCATTRKLLRRIKEVTSVEPREGEPCKKKKVVVIPYKHKLSHGLKNVAGRFGINVVFSAPIKMGKICGRIERKLAESDIAVKKKCSVKHRSPLVECKTGVVYQIPFNCGHVYVGQTGRCINIRLLEHKNSLKNKKDSHVTRHCSEHGCFPLFHDTTILSVHTNQITREVIEAFHIRKRGDICISEPSIALHEKEFLFLDKSVT